MVTLRAEGWSLRAIAETMVTKGFCMSHMALKEITMRAQGASKGA
jgi:hypothetical protein